MKLKLTGKELRAIGYPEGPVISLAMNIMEKAFRHLSKEDALEILSSILQSPNQYAHDGVLNKIAEALLPKPRAGGDELPLAEKGIHFNVFGAEGIEQGALQQMHTAAKLPVAVAGALMPDAHHGYGLPIGGVLATENAVIPYGVGVDIGCRMALSIFDINPKELTDRENYFTRELNEATLFGSGSVFQKPSDHEVMERPEFGELGLLKGLQGRAWKQLGSSGSGNHFVEWGIVEIKGKDEVLGVEAGTYVGLLSHSGSRALGANVANHYTKLAKEARRLPGDAVNLAWLRLDEQEGIEYWMAMNLAGDYASACHQVIHDKIARQLGRKPVRRVENHHNFCLPSTEKIPTPTGYKYINELKKGDVIYSFDEQHGVTTTEIADVWYTGRKPVLEIETKHRKIRVTENHPLKVLEVAKGSHPFRKGLTKMQGRYVWKRAGQIKKGDIVVCVHGYYNSNHDGNGALARFMGAYLGDGWVKRNTKNGYYFGLAIGGPEEAHTNRYLSLMEQLPVMKTEKRTWKSKTLHLKNNAAGSYGISGSDKDVYRFIESLGLAEESTKRRVPQLVFSFSVMDKIEFLSGYMDADGSIASKKHKDGSGLIRACNKGLVEDLREIAIGCGLYVSNVRAKSVKTNYGSTVVYSFKISPHGMARLNLWHKRKLNSIYQTNLTRTGLHKRKLGHVELPRNAFAEKVLRVEVGSLLEDVWDLEVADESHSFVCEGIVVHNCWRETYEDKNVYVHRKGATPAGKDVLGIIPGSMAAPGFIVKGKGEAASVNSASHGAGRKMSRTAALKSVTHKELNEALAKQGVKLLGGGLDEAPFAYKDIHEVMKAQSALVEAVGIFHPKIVKMDGAQPKQWRKKNRGAQDDGLLSGE